jgi:hypothetical protein
MSKSMLPESEQAKESVLAVFLRFLIYTMVIFGMALSLPVVSVQWNFAGYTDGSSLEWIQFCVIFSTAIMLFASGWYFKKFRILFFLLASMAGIASIREMDYVMNKTIPFFGWWLPAILVALAAIAMALRNRHLVKEQLFAFVLHRSFGLMWAGFICAVPVAQLVGHGPFLEAALGDDFRRSHKRLIEEIGELLGYILILIGSIEWTIKVNRESRIKK